jgi:hypothetical protein
VERKYLEEQVKKNERGGFIKSGNPFVKDCITEQSGYILYGDRSN